MTPEGKVKVRVKKMLEQFSAVYEVGIWSHWPVQTGYGSPTLDCTGAMNKLAFAIETKAPGEHPTPRQELTIAEMRKAGVAVFVIGEDMYLDDRGRRFYTGELDLLKWLHQHK